MGGWIRMDKAIEQLEEVLRQQLAASRNLLALLQRKQQAIRRSDRHAVESLCREENVQVQGIAALEKERLMLVAELTQAIDPAARTPLKLLALAERMPEPARGRLLVLRAELTELVLQTQREAGIARRATEALVKHMQGVINTVGGALTGVMTYSRNGAMPRAASAISTFCATA